MKRIRTEFVCWALGIVAASLLPAVAWADSPANQGASGPAPVAVGYEEQLITTPVTVEDIDRKTRMLTVRTPDGQRSTVHVPPEVQRFDKLKKGDKIDLAYYRAVAVHVVPAHPTSTNNSNTNNGQPRQTTATATPAQVVSVNKRDNTMQVKAENGKTQTVSAGDDGVRQNMQNLKPGDVVELIYTEAEATSILPSSSGQ